MKSGHAPNKGLQVIPLALSLAELFHREQYLYAGNSSLKGFGKSLWRNTESIIVNSLSLSFSLSFFNA